MTSVAGTTQAGAARTVRIAVVVAVALAVGGAHFWYGNRHNYYDLRIYYDAINWWADGHPLYSFSHLDRIQGPLGFTYPPFAAVLMYPMAWAPLGVVIAVLLLANLAALAVTTAWLVIPLADRHGWPRWFALGLALPLVTTLEPIRETITFGQINLLLVLLVAAALAPHDSWRYWTFTVWQANQVGHLDRIPNQALWGTMLRLAAPHQPSRLLWLALVAVVAGYGLWRAARAGRGGDDLAGMTLASLVGLPVSPVSWQHHLYWFVPALVVLVDAAAAPGRFRTWYGAFAAVIWVTVTVGVIAFFDYGLSSDLLDTVPGFLISNWYLLLMLLLVAVLPYRAAVAVRRPAEPVPAASER